MSSQDTRQALVDTLNNREHKGLHTNFPVGSCGNCKHSKTANKDWYCYEGGTPQRVLPWWGCNEWSYMA